jgi:putative nucleotidyltransferase with HDIG domain
MSTQTARAEGPGPDEKLAEQMCDIVLKRVQSDRLVLPTPSAAAKKCLDLLKDPDVNMRQVARQLEVDPMLAAKVLRMAGSAAMGGQVVANVEQAVARVGATKLKTLLIDASARKLFESRDTRIAEAFRQLWEHSLAVAMLARDVAALCGAEDTDAAYLAGLLHDIGKPVMGAMMLEAERMIAGGKSGSWVDAGTWLTSVQRVHRQVGKAIAETWKLPPLVCKIIADSSEYDSSGRKSAVNAVCFANALAKSQGFYAGSCDVEDAGALVMIGRSLLGIDDEPVKALLTNLRDRIKTEVG